MSLGFNFLATAAEFVVWLEGTIDALALACRHSLHFCWIITILRLYSWNEPVAMRLVVDCSEGVALDGAGTGRLRMGAVAAPTPAKLENEDMREKVLGVVLGID